MVTPGDIDSFLPRNVRHSGTRRPATASGILKALALVMAPVVIFGVITYASRPSRYPTAEVGPYPTDVAFLADNRRAVVRDARTHEVTVADTDNGTVTRIPTAPANALLLAPDRRHAYVAHGDASAVSVVNLDTGQALATAPLGGRVPLSLAPIRLAIAPDGGQLYALLPVEKRVVVLDSNGLVVRASWPAAVDAGAEDVVALLATRDHLHVVLAAVLGDSGTILTLDSGTGETIARTRLEGPPSDAELAPDGRLLIASAQLERVLAVDVTSAATSVLLGDDDYDQLALSPGGLLHVTFDPPGRTAHPQTSVVDIGSARVLETFTTGDADDLAVSPDGQRLLVADAYADGGELRTYVIGSAVAGT